MSVLNNKEVIVECRLQHVGVITHLDCDTEHLLVATWDDMKLYDIQTRKQPALVSTAPTGYVVCCALAYPFAAATGYTVQKGIVIWDMRTGVATRRLHSHLNFFFLSIKDNIIAAGTVSEELKSEE